MDKWEYGEKYGFHKEVEEPTEYFNRKIIRK